MEEEIYSRKNSMDDTSIDLADIYEQTDEFECNRPTTMSELNTPNKTGIDVSKIAEEILIEKNDIDAPTVDPTSTENEPAHFPTSLPTVNFEIIPKIVFIIPYRDREEHLREFVKHMAYLLEDVPKTDYRFYIIHQADKRGFNRGAIKNIGFLYIKDKYPNDYQNMTIVFNDVDTMPKEKNYVNYATTHGIIKHFCGFTYTLGGIVCITGKDLERTNGFPNFWGWGYEDNALNERANRAGIVIDRSIFCDFSKQKYPFDHFISLSSGAFRIVNKTEYGRYINKTREGFRNIQQIRCNTNLSELSVDSSTIQLVSGDGGTDRGNISTDVNEYTVLNVLYFYTGVEENIKSRVEHDLRNGSQPFGKIINRRNGSLPMMNMSM